MPSLRSLIKLLPLFVAFNSLVYSRAQPGGTFITNCLDILKLTPEKANQQLPVRVRGVVTSYAPASQLCFVQDGTAGIYVQPAPWPKDLRFGEVVDVEGLTAQGRFSPIIFMGVIKRTGIIQIPEPRRISANELKTGRFDSQFVEMEGVVQKATVTGNVIDLQMMAGGSHFIALVFNLENPATNSVDARVRLRGVAGTFYSGDQLTGFGLFLEDSSFVEILQPPAVPFSQPIRALNNLHSYSPEGALDHRIQVKGVVTGVWPGEAFFLRDSHGTIRVSPADPTPMPEQGDITEVLGFLQNATTLNPSIAHALWRKSGQTNVAFPKPTALSIISAAPASGQLVTLEGTVLDAHNSNKVSSLVLRSDEQTLRVFSPNPVPDNLVDASVRISGVISTPPDFLNSAEKALLLLATNGLSVLGTPSAAPLRRSFPIVTAASVSAALILAAIAFAAHKSSRQTLTLAESNIQRLQEAEKEVALLKDARDRLGRDLHDHIIQSIYAIGLSLEDCRHALADPQRLDSRLKSVLSEINDVNRELRNVLAGLESNTIQPKEFRTALKSLALTLEHQDSNRIRIELDQSAVDALTTSQATELIHIAREAMSNSVRHGHAHTTSVILQNQQDQLRFVIEDDGSGFTPGESETKGYGLRNMAKRAEDLGAKFTIHAQKGLGTRIVLDIPKQNQHLSKL
jgi:signal transduction histidine kinase